MLAGCKHKYDPLLGGWIPLRNKDMETSNSDIYSVGDGAGIEGSKVTINEGRIAGITVAHKLGFISNTKGRKLSVKYRSRLKRLKRFQNALNDISFHRSGLSELVKNDTIICRCEEITLGEIKEAIADGARDMGEIKRMTRLGMGRCQGRMCEPSLVNIIMKELNGSHAELSQLYRRPPTKPVEIGILAKFKTLE